LRRRTHRLEVEDEGVKNIQDFVDRRRVLLKMHVENVGK